MEVRGGKVMLFKSSSHFRISEGTREFPLTSFCHLDLGAAPRRTLHPKSLESFESPADGFGGFSFQFSLV